MNSNRKKLITITCVVVCFIVYSWIKKVNTIDILSGHYNVSSQISKFYKSGSGIKITNDSPQQSFLVYGPYLPLDEGGYSVKFKLRLNNLNEEDPPEKMVAVCDVSIDKNPDKCVSKELKVKDFIKSNPTTKVIKFSVPAGKPACEFRVFLYYGNNLTVEEIKLHPRSMVNILRLLNKQGFLKIYIAMPGVLLLIFFVFYTRKKLSGRLKFKKINALVEIAETNNNITLNYLIHFSIIAFFSLLILNAYWMNKMQIAIVPSMQIIWICLEILIFWFISKKMNLKLTNIKYEIFDSALFVFVLGFISYVLLIPSMPTFIPVNFSDDCVTHFSHIDYIYKHKMFTGSVINSYPFGYHLVTAMLSKFTGIPAIKMMQILLAFSVGLTTAITYSLIVRIFNLKKDGKLMAIIPIFMLFWVRGYYEFSFNKFFHAPMIFSYLFMMSFFWALIEYDNHPKWFNYLALNLSAIGLVYTYTSYLPILIIPLFLTVILNGKKSVAEKIKDFAITSVPVIILGILHLKSGDTTKIGTGVLNHEGYCIPFRFYNFGDFDSNRIGGNFLQLTIIGILMMLASFKRNAVLIYFTVGFLFYFGVFFVAKHYFGLFSYYQAYKILYFSPYIAVIYIASILYIIRKQFIKIISPYIGQAAEKVLLVLWIILIIVSLHSTYSKCNYHPYYVQMLTEPVYKTMDWARNNIKEKFSYIYHHPSIGNWMKQGFMNDDFKNTPPAEYWTQVFAQPVPRLTDWLAKSKTGDIAVVDDMNNPTLTEEQKNLFEILYQNINSAVIKRN